MKDKTAHGGDMPAMRLLKNIKFQISIAVLFGLILVGFILVLVVHQDAPETVSENGAPKQRTDSFTFFDLGSHTVFTEAVREKLSGRLGSDAIGNWTTIDLELSHKDLLREHFPILDDLNRNLNNAAGARVEHNTIQLTYR